MKRITRQLRQEWNQYLKPFEISITCWMARHSASLSRISLGMIFLWFGALKLVPGLSPAEDLASRTLLILTNGLFTPATCVLVLACLESLIGLALLSGKAPRLTLLFLFGHMAGTVTPLFLFPGEIFVQIPFVLTFEGQYIAKNLVLVSAAIVVGASLRRGSVPAPCVQRPKGNRTFRPSAGSWALKRVMAE